MAINCIQWKELHFEAVSLHELDRVKPERICTQERMMSKSKQHLSLGKYGKSLRCEHICFGCTSQIHVLESVKDVLMVEYRPLIQAQLALLAEG